MEAVKEFVTNCRANASDDDKFIDDLNKLADKNGNIIYEAAIQILFDLEFESEKAKKCWFEIVAHRDKISEILGRRVSLITSISDYFDSYKILKKQYKIVETNVYKKTIKESTHDSLTGFFNKIFFQRTLNQYISLAERNNSDLSVLFLDIDDFKEINDTFGHNAGDMVLKDIAHTIKLELRASDIVARFGGDEFVILMPNTHKVNAFLLSERLRKKIMEKSMAIKNKKLQITVSGGVAGFPADAQKISNLLNMADSALYRAKGAGKNMISLFKEDKRRFLRVKFNRSIKVKHLGFSRTRTLSGKSKDIAIGGILFENKEPLAIGTKIQVNIPIVKNSEPVLLIGTVVRVEVFGPDKYDIGMILSFKEMEKTAKNEISKFLIQQSNDN